MNYWRKSNLKESSTCLPKGGRMPCTNSDEVLVIGHHDPDTDAVCSAIAYASLYTWQTGNQAVPCHLDHLNRETAWLLEHVGIPAPRAIKDVYLRVSDVMRTDAPALYPDHTLREAGLMMQHRDLGALPVVDRVGKLVGLLERDKLADRYLAELHCRNGWICPLNC